MSRTKNMFVLWMTVITLSWLFTACMDEETVGKDKQPKIPYTSWDNPVAFGEEVIIKGSNFSASDRVELEYMGIRKNAQIKTCTDKELGFIVPEFSSDNIYESALSTSVYLIRNNQECELGYLYVGSSDVLPPDNVSQRVMVLLTPFKEYYFQYERNDLCEVKLLDRDQSVDSYYRIEKRNVTDLQVAFENSNSEADTYHVQLEDGLVSAIFSEKHGRVYDVARTYDEVVIRQIGSDACDVSYMFADYQVEINVQLGTRQKHWSVTYGRSISGGLTVNLNAMLGYQYEDELLNVLNLAGYLVKPGDRLMTDFHYYESEDDYQLVAIDASYEVAEDYMNRIERIYSNVYSLEPADYPYIPLEMYIIYE